MSEKYAFPGYLHTRLENGEMHAESFPGLTKRELFAAMVAAELAAAKWARQFDPQEIAEIAIEQANSLLERLNGETP